MKIVNNDFDKNIFLNSETNFRLDLGWEENFQDFEKETLKSIINPSENFETVRFIHDPYVSNTIEQSDIWYYFYFYNNLNPQTHIGGLDYEYVGITARENQKLLRQTSESFFRLEFYKTPTRFDVELDEWVEEKPDRTNRKLVFTKHLTIPLGERVFYTPLNDLIFVPVFTGSNYRNKENMYLFWFQDETVLNGTFFTGNTFYMTARFFNAKDGSISNFANKSISTTGQTIENVDFYYKMVIEKTNYSYQIFQYDGITGSRAGTSSQPIKFYEVIGGG